MAKLQTPIDPAAEAPRGHAWYESAEATRYGHVAAIIRAEGHTWIGDEQSAWVPKATDLGPSPFTQLYGALAHCTISTVSDRCAMDGIPLEGCRVRVRGLCTKPRGAHWEGLRIAYLDRAIEVTGRLTPEHLEHIRRVAEGCPVHLSLEGAIRIGTTLQHLDELLSEPAPSAEHK